MKTHDAPLLRAVDCRWLLALYSLVPLALLLVAADLLLAGGHLHAWLPADPMLWPFWTVVFGLPHIIASLITMADREYLGHYRKSLLLPTLLFAGIACAGYLGPQPVSYQVLFVFLAFYTIYHVLAQQLGLTLMMMGSAPSRLFQCWKWLAVLAGFAIYINVYGGSRVGNLQLGGISLYQMLGYLSVALCAGVVALAIRLGSQARYRIGLWYLWGNVALLLSALLIEHAGYTLLVILVPRVIHDVTAYIIYISHDGNRNQTRPVNAIYRLMSFSRLPPVILLPVLSVLLAYLLTSYQHYPLIGVLILTLSFLHYYFEGFIWRTPNPHRQYLVFRR